MPKLVFLGTSNAIPDETHENTHMLFWGREKVVLIDCGTSPLLRFKKIGLDFNLLTDVILTHFHPDHVSGLPQLLVNMWLLGRKAPLNIHGLAHTMDRIEGLLDFYAWTDWPGFFPVFLHRVPDNENTRVISSNEFLISASPVKHFIPTIGLRVEMLQNKKVLVYSCDTEPCPQVTRMAEGADILIHEASGAEPGHSSASQAGEAAARAEVGELFLVHYPTGDNQTGNLVAQASEMFKGIVALATDYQVIDLD